MLSGTTKLALCAGLAATTLAHQGDLGPFAGAKATVGGPPKVESAAAPAPPAVDSWRPAAASVNRRVVRVRATAATRDWKASLPEALPVVSRIDVDLPQRTDVAPDMSNDTAGGSATAFAGAVVRLSAQAEQVDRVWAAYKQTCQVSVRRRYDYGREWFALWDRGLESALETPACAELMWRVLQAGETVRHELLAARSSAQQSRLAPETEHGMLRWHALEWN
jgi:hypothetical protein